MCADGLIGACKVRIDIVSTAVVFSAVGITVY